MARTGAHTATLPVILVSYLEEHPIPSHQRAAHERAPASKKPGGVGEEKAGAALTARRWTWWTLDSSNVRIKGGAARRVAGVRWRTVSTHSWASWALGSGIENCLGSCCPRRLVEDVASGCVRVARPRWSFALNQQGSPLPIFFSFSIK